MKIITILGARPQFVKAAMVSKALLQDENIKECIVHTGQHFDKNMSDIFFETMQIPKPSYRLNINSSQHGEMTGKMLVAIEEVLLKEKPDWVLVYGDTNSTLAGALAASKLHIPIAHVEAGLRSFNMQMPEEVNRIVTDRLSKKLFCPTSIAKENLIKEGFIDFPCNIDVVGDVMYDAALHYVKFNTENSEINQIMHSGQPFVLATIHRAENTDREVNLKAIFQGLNKIAEKVQVILPLHPRTAKRLKEFNIQSKVKFVNPLGYIEMLSLLKSCQLVITDSGGLQKEAYFFNKYCLTAREQTEWMELVHHGANVLVGTNAEKMIEHVNAFLGQSFKGRYALYGDGQAAQKIKQAFAT